MERIHDMLERLNVDPVFVFLSASAVIKYGVNYLWKDRIPPEAEQVGRVSQLLLFPIKSVQAIELKQGECTPIGLQSGILLDRHFQLVAKEDGVWTSINAKNTPVITSVKLTASEDGKVFTLEGPKGTKVTLNWYQLVQQSRNVLTVKTHGAFSKGIDCGDEIGKWFDNIIGKSGNRLVFSATDIQKRQVQTCNVLPKFVPWLKTADPSQQVAFQDNTSFLLFNQRSLDDLNTRLDKPLDAARFRPNIVVSDAPAYDEDTWKEIIIGEARFATIKQCNRCPVTTIDWATGVRDPDQEPLRTLRKYRMNVPQMGSPILGMNVVVTKPGTVRAWDPVYVVRGDTATLPA